MSFDLRITFTGMCLFVPDGREAATPRMHVLMPATHAHGGEIVRHDARLFFDRAYLRQGSPELTRELECTLLDRRALNFAGLPGGASQVLPSEIVNLADTLGRRVPPDRLTARPPAEVKSRITLDGGAVTDYVLGAAWDLPGHADLPLTWRVEWTVRGITRNQLDWEIVGLDPATPTQQLPTLFPMGGVVHVLVHHVLPTELPGQPPTAMNRPGMGDPATHFAAFYGLAVGGASNDVPKFKGELMVNALCQEVPVAEEHEEHEEHAEHAEHAEHGGEDAGPAAELAALSAAPAIFMADSGRGGSPFTCMAAQSVIG